MRLSVASLVGIWVVSIAAASLGGCEGNTDDGSSPDAGPGVGFDAGGPDDNDGSTGDGAVVDACPALTGAGTTHTTAISADETWTAAASPHIVPGDIQIATGATLTLEPCAVVQIAGDHGLTVQGRLYAPGTASNPIRIDGSDAAKPFSAIQTINGGTVDLANVTITNGGAATFDPAALYIRGDGTTLKPALRAVNVTIDGAPQYGLVLTSLGQMSPDSSGLTIRNAKLGPVRASAPAAGSLPVGVYTGNGVDEILIDADAPIAADMTLKDLGLPYRLGNVTANAGSDLRVGAPGTATQPDRHAVLTLEAGVTIRVEPAGRVLMQSPGDAASLGALVANGTAAKPVVFTSAASAPAPGDWVGLYFAGAPDPQDKLDFLHVEYAGGPSLAISAHCDPMGGLDEVEDAAIIILGGPPGSAFVTNSVITSSKAYGIDRGWTGAPVDFTAGNTFTGNGKCSQSFPRPTEGACPVPAPCP